jgi:hypothetical protein
MNALNNKRMTIDEAVDLIENADLKTLGRMASEMKAKLGILHTPTKRDDTFSPKKIDNTPPLAPKAFKKTYIANTLKGKN